MKSAYVLLSRLYANYYHLIYNINMKPYTKRYEDQCVKILPTHPAMKENVW